MMNNTFNYSENKQLWTIENIAKENGFEKVADCYWSQIFRNENGEEFFTVREDKIDVEPVEAVKAMFSKNEEENEVSEENNEEQNNEYKANVNNNYVDIEHNEIINELDLLREYLDKPLEERNEQTFYQFLKECTGKNGTLQKLEV